MVFCILCGRGGGGGGGLKCRKNIDTYCTHCLLCNQFRNHKRPVCDLAVCP